MLFGETFFYIIIISSSVLYMSCPVLIPEFHGPMWDDCSFLYLKPPKSWNPMPLRLEVTLIKHNGAYF